MLRNSNIIHSSRILKEMGKMELSKFLIKEVVRQIVFLKKLSELISSIKTNITIQ